MIQRLIKSERGASIVEFALIAPVLVFLLIGLIDVGRGMYYGIVAANAARAGASYGSQSLTTASDTAGMTTAINNDSPGVTWSTPAPTYLCSVSGAAPVACATGGTTAPANTVYYVKVVVTGSFPTLIHYPGLPASIPVSGTSVMRVVSQ